MVQHSDTSNLPARQHLDRLLAACAAAEASDLHLSSGRPPLLRLHGELISIEGEPVVAPPDMEALAALLAAPASAPEQGSMDGAVSGPDGSRFRFNLFRQQGELAAALRRLEDEFLSLEQLGLPASLDALCDLRDGLVIIAGPTGAGKSTTLATLLDRINRTHTCHIVTIEDPIEYLHRPQKALVHQRQVGQDAGSFNEALVASLRQDPDVILVGEVRDLATIRTAITAAETGHLVFTTVHAGDCVGAVERLVGVFPADEQDGIRRQLSLVLRCIVTQHLLPSATGPNRRAVASEVLHATPAIASLIVNGKSAQIYSAMESGSTLGMQTLEQDLARLCALGKISESVAVARARNVPILRDRLTMARRKFREEI